MLWLSSLASGSSGNCTLISSGKEDVLIDAGISARAIVKALSGLEKDLSSVKGVFLTHEHTDHVRGAGRLQDLGIPVFANAGTAEASGLSGMRIIRTDHALEFRGMRILPFSKSHDANEPVSYRVTNSRACVSVITDVGYGCRNTIESIRNSDALVLEANHDSFLLKRGKYPEELKRRILGKQGHLSNYEAALLLLEHAKPGLQHVILGHLSEQNNTPEAALRTFRGILSERKDLEKVRIHVAPRNAATPLLKVE